MYTPVGRNWTLTFEAAWSYGDSSGQPVRNATVTIQVSNSKNQVVNTLSLNTTAGVFSFNYSSSTADALTFTPVKLATQDGTEWKTNLIDAQKNLYGLQSKSAVVWWDTFQVSPVSHNTGTIGSTSVSVNVTYLLLPEDGLTLPEWATYSNETFLPKTVQNAAVSINGAKAEETSDGIFSANVPTWLPTSYVIVEVSQNGWVTTHTAFSFAQDANEPPWLLAAAFFVALMTILIVFFIRARRRKESNLSRKMYYAVLGGFLLAISSAISLYWGLVGLEGALNGFEWLLLAAMGFVSFGLGLVASALSIARKRQALVISALIAPMITNLIIAKTSLDTYQLANPLLILFGSIFLSVASLILICNADEVFT